MVAKSEYNKVFANNLRRIMHERDKNGADMARFFRPNGSKSRLSVPTNISGRIIVPIKKAPQNAK